MDGEPLTRTCTAGSCAAVAKSSPSRLVQARMRDGCVPGGPCDMRDMALSLTLPSKLWGSAAGEAAGGMGG